MTASSLIRHAPGRGRSLGLAAKLRLTLSLLLLACVGVVSLLVWRSYDALLESKLRLTRNVVAQSVKIVERYQQQAAAGQLPEAEARARALAEVRALRYDGQEYVWINDLQPRMVAHPIKPELDGKDLADFKDPNGKRLFIEMVAVVKAGGEGYVDYLWPKPGSPDPEPKRSFVKLFAPWGWVMGSGVYVDDVRAVARQEASIALIAVGILSGLALLTIEWLARGMVKRMRSAGGLLEGMAQGDLTHHIDPGPADEVGHLLRQAASTQQRLSGLVRQIHSASDSIAVASREIASGNQDLSNRTEETASNLQQAASAMVELTGAVRQSASAAAQANQLAASAAEVAARGGTVVGEVVSTMNEINASSRRISDIITVIDGIAFQTNILALNAAVEAARAGEQGRGFAVVAGEVRSLAQRSASAAKEIKCLINDSVERVDTGSRLVGQAGETMDEIVSSVRRVSDIIGEVTTAAVEQSNGIEGVNKSVMLLDQMTQQNAALVEQSAAAADSLRQQAQDLSGTVSAFRLTRDADSPGPSPQAAPAAPAPVPAGSAGFATKLAARLPSAHGGSTPAAAPAAPATAQGGGDDWQSF